MLFLLTAALLIWSPCQQPASWSILQWQQKSHYCFDKCEVFWLAPPDSLEHWTDPSSLESLESVEHSTHGSFLHVDSTAEGDAVIQFQFDPGGCRLSQDLFYHPLFTYIIKFKLHTYLCNPHDREFCSFLLN